MKKELFPANTIDSVDYNLNYMKSVVQFDWWESKWKNYNDWFISNAIPKLKSLNISGTMIFTGVYTGEDYSLLKYEFPEMTFIGIDVYRYTDDDIIIADVRDYLPSINVEIDIMWNGIGPWPWSRDSKQACFDYAKKYLKSGGLYIDHVHTSKDAPHVIEDADFSLLDPNFLMMEKL
jgi:hypothetical protein